MNCGRVIPSIEASQLALVLKEPYGVVAAIVPWNYPILLMAWKVAPILAVGNTVMTNVDHSMAIMREETFGPTIPVMKYRSFDEAIALANDSKYGLGANLYTHDPVKAERFFEEVEAGMLWINDPLTDNDAKPFGGFKMSGISRELGEEGLDEFRETKHVHWDFEGAAKSWWYPYAKR
jgi:acyl-CoA reductase-like NAD-dependent aldehyde dehydrogenase